MNGGELTPEAIGRAMDALWSQDRERHRPDRFTGLRSMLGGEEAAELDGIGWPTDEEFGRLLWIDGIRRHLRLVLSGETWIRHLHPHGFRYGQWARLTWEAEFRGRWCYCVTFEDGLMDYWDPRNRYEFFPARPGPQHTGT
jgi:hypothetical protein